MATPESPNHSENHSWPWGEAEVAFSSAIKQCDDGPSVGPCSVAFAVFQLTHILIVTINSLLIHAGGSRVCIFTSTDLPVGFVSTRYTRPHPQSLPLNLKTSFEASAFHLSLLGGTVARRLVSEKLSRVRKDMALCQSHLATSKHGDVSPVYPLQCVPSSDLVAAGCWVEGSEAGGPWGGMSLHLQCYNRQCGKALGWHPCLGCHTCSCSRPLSAPPDSPDSCEQPQVQLS